MSKKHAEGLAPSTIEGYRTAIVMTVKQVTGRDLSQDCAISALLRSFRLTALKNRNEIPVWNLSLVLSVLAKPLFEPIELTNSKLTLKF